MNTLTETTDNPTAYISKEWETHYQVLCRGETAIFDQSSNLFTLCAAIGHTKERKRPLTEKKGLFRWVALNTENNLTILSAIAWDFKGRDLSVLVDKKEILNITSEYAEGGMAYLNEMYFEDYLESNQLTLPKKIDLEFELAQIIEGLREEQSLFE